VEKREQTFVAECHKKGGALQPLSETGRDCETREQGKFGEEKRFDVKIPNLRLAPEGGGFANRVPSRLGRRQGAKGGNTPFFFGGGGEKKEKHKCGENWKEWEKPKTKNSRWDELTRPTTASSRGKGNFSELPLGVGQGDTC